MGFINRREFLQDSAALAALFAGMGSFESLEAAEPKPAKKRDVNDQLQVAVVGVHGQGMSHVGGYAGRHNCIVATICDVDSAVISRAMTSAEKAQHKTPKYEQDIRRVLDDKSIDIISIAAPNHWHALAAIWAMQAGKDVYVEKPVSHNVSEGRRMVETARKRQRICQTGTQIRSSAGSRQAIDFLHAGKLGKLQVARALCYKKRDSIGKVNGPQEPPKTMDYNLWCGPAPFKPPHRKTIHGTVHYDWHWFWDYGNGDLGNQGIHQMDVARWGLGKNQLPQGVISVGGRFGYIDDGETPNTQICVFDFGDSELIFEVRGLKTDPFKGAKVGNVFHCTDGYLVFGDYNGAVAFNPAGEVIQKFNGSGDHFGNFVQAVRNRKMEDLHADILEGHLSSALCHLGNISYRLGTMQPFNKKTKSFGDDKEAYETLARMEEHLKENMVPLDDTSYRVGRRLAFDPKTETFVSDKEADALLTREYRKGFEVPATV
jgi:predicted dehydrogenase